MIEAIKEIEQVVRKYDLGAYVNLEDKGCGGFKLIFPTWSIVKVQEDGHIILQFRKANHQNGEFTTGMFYSMRARAAALLKMRGKKK